MTGSWNAFGSYQVGKVTLTRRELEVLHHVARWRTTPQIAQILCVSDRTVSFHLQNVSVKLGLARNGGSVRNMSVARARELGFPVDMDPATYERAWEDWRREQRGMVPSDAAAADLEGELAE